MVRAAVACAVCRKHKVKCVHDGKPPCRACFKKGRIGDGQCVLSLPDLVTRRGTTTTTPRPGHRSGPSRSATAATAAISSAPAYGLSPEGIGSESYRQPPTPTTTDASLVVRVFCRKFPELRFVHESILLASIRSSARPPGPSPQHVPATESSKAPRSHQRLLYTALEALCLPLLDAADDSRTPQAISEDRARQARESIPLADPPTVPLVQALLVLSMYEWATGSGFRAWNYTGMAIRMMQSLSVLPAPETLAGVEAQVFNRTIWGCFVMDRLVFCGRPQPFTLSVASLHAHWPVSEEDFAFGEASSPSRPADEERGLLEGMGSDMNQYYGILVRGFDIWARIRKWIVGGGRRIPGMSLPENHPWVPGSPWRLLYDELQAWRSRQARRLHYVPGSPKLHAALGQGEAFAYLNLIYYVSLIFLEREYVPFLPSPESEPVGPVDPPLLSDPAPAGWWHDRAAELFAAAASVPQLLVELRDADAALTTPFAGFCAFSAATMNLYVSAFPNMNLKRGSEDSFDILVANMSLLDSFRAVWSMGEGWWVTIQHCRRLYEHAGRGAAQLRGRTRDDYVALESSIHDARAQPPEADVADVGDPADETQDMDDDDDDGSAGVATIAAAQGLQGLSAALGEDGTPGAEAYPESAAGLDLAAYWQTWPLWGDQLNVPYAIEGIPFDYNFHGG